jgi:hypothetical protein
LIEGNGADSVRTVRESSGTRHTLALDGIDIANGGGGSDLVGGQLRLGRDYPNYWRVQCAPGNFCSRVEGNVAGLDCPTHGADAGIGGGVYLDKVSAYVSQTLVSDNCARDAAAFFSWGPSTRIESTVFARNLIEESLHTEMGVASDSPLRSNGTGHACRVTNAGASAYRNPRCSDDPNYNRGGTCDIGAAEAPLDPFFAGFGNDFE